MADSPDREPGRTEHRDQASPSNEFRGHWISVVLLILTVFTIGFGFCGFVQQYSESQRQQRSSDFDWTIPVYRTVQLLILNSGTEEPDNLSLAVGRMLAACTFLVLTAAVAMRVFQETTQLPVRMTRTGHIVICGLGEIGRQLLDDLHRAGRSRRVVVIEQDENHFEFERARRLGADIVLGDATRGETLKRARAHCAETVFTVCGDDGINLEIAAELAEILHRQPRVRYRKGSLIPLRIGLHLHDVKLAETVRTLSRTQPDAELLNLSIFSVARTSATHVVTQLVWPFAPKMPNEVAHFVILGFGPMGREMAAILARLGHFPNRKRSRFTIADHDCETKSREFVSRFGRFTAWSDTTVGVSRFDADRDDWSSRTESVPEYLASTTSDAIDYVANAQFRNLPPDLGDEAFARSLLASFADTVTAVKPIIFVCGENDRENFHDAVRLRDVLIRLGAPTIPIFVWLPRQPALAQSLRSQSTLIPFGEYRDSAGLEEVLHPQREQLAQAVHRHYEQLATEPAKTTCSWDEAQEELRESNRQMADHFDIKLAYLGWKLVNYLGNRQNSSSRSLPVMDEAQQHLLAEMEHNRWVAERLMAGWSYAPMPSTAAEIAANKQRKRHHDLVPWDKLGGDQHIDVELLNAILQEAQRSQYQLEPLA